MKSQPCHLLLIVFLCTTLFSSQRELVEANFDWKISGTGHSAFFPENKEATQNDVIAFLQINPDLSIESANSWVAVMAPRFRFGLTDSEYHFVSLDDVYAEYVTEFVEIRAGYQTHSWGAMESFNIVDVFNQRDYRVDFFDPKVNKIGEPAIRIRTILREDVVDFFYIPAFTPANLPDKINPYNPFAGRLDIIEDGLYTSDGKRLRPQFIARWNRMIGTADVGLAYFNGYEKFPIINRTPRKFAATSFYYEIQQVSTDLQMSLGDWLLKGEALYQDTGIADSFLAESVLPNGQVVVRDLVPKDFAAFAVGFEYIIYRFQAESDFGFIMEYFYNTQQDLNAVAFRPFQNDFFMGIRWSRNNLGGGEFLGGLIIDLTNGTQLWRAEYSERFFDRIKFMAYLEIINATKGDSLRPFDAADNVAIQFSYVY